jgi:mRNA-degrading endonuclease RelE of RelBE toxin-antitoxin system
MSASAPYRIRLSREAVRQLARWFTAAERARLRDTITEQLAFEPAAATRNRKPFARPNPHATWELRVGALRVLYDIDETERVVLVNAVGRKAGNRVLIDGQEVAL